MSIFPENWELLDCLILLLSLIFDTLIFFTVLFLAQVLNYHIWKDFWDKEIKLLKLRHNFLNINFFIKLWPQVQNNVFCLWIFAFLKMVDEIFSEILSLLYLLNFSSSTLHSNQSLNIENRLILIIESWFDVRDLIGSSFILKNLNEVFHSNQTNLCWFKLGTFYKHSKPLWELCGIWINILKWKNLIQDVAIFSVCRKLEFVVFIVLMIFFD